MSSSVASPNLRDVSESFERRFALLLIVLVSIVLSACSQEPTNHAVAPQADLAEATYAVSPWPLIAGNGSAQPDLIVAPNGRLLLTWISSEVGRRPALLFSSYDGLRWQHASRTVAVGTGLFANWADTPHLAATRDGAFWVHWLQQSPNAAGAYDILLSRSRSNGRSWSPPIMVNDDGTASEHGFVSLWAQSDDALGAAWLDGRNTVAAVGHSDSKDAHAGHDGHAGPMMLRAALFDNYLQRNHEVQLDAMTCDCCQTDVAITARGALLAYRGRTPQEIRDILTARFDGGAWTKPQRVHADDWKMPACPVNGPAIAARGNDAVVAWYTAAGNVPALKIARSTDAGNRFAAPVLVDRGDAVQGRVDVALDGAQAWVLWLREDDSGQSLWLARYAADLSRELQRFEVARLQGRGRGTGFPKLALRGEVAYVVWTDVVDGKPRLQGATVQVR